MSGRPNENPVLEILLGDPTDRAVWNDSRAGRGRAGIGQMRQRFRNHLRAANDDEVDPFRQRQRPDRCVQRTRRSGRQVGHVVAQSRTTLIIRDIRTEAMGDQLPRGVINRQPCVGTAQLIRIIDVKRYRNVSWFDRRHGGSRCGVADLDPINVQIIFGGGQLRAGDVVTKDTGNSQSAAVTGQQIAQIGDRTGGERNVVRSGIDVQPTGQHTLGELR